MRTIVATARPQAATEAATPTASQRRCIRRFARHGGASDAGGRVRLPRAGVLRCTGLESICSAACRRRRRSGLTRTSSGLIGSSMHGSGAWPAIPPRQQRGRTWSRSNRPGEASPQSCTDLCKHPSFASGGDGRRRAATLPGPGRRRQIVPRRTLVEQIAPVALERRKGVQDSPHLRLAAGHSTVEVPGEAAFSVGRELLVRSVGGLGGRRTS